MSKPRSQRLCHKAVFTNTGYGLMIRVWRLKPKLAEDPDNPGVPLFFLKRKDALAHASVLRRKLFVDSCRVVWLCAEFTAAWPMTKKQERAQGKAQATVIRIY